MIFRVQGSRHPVQGSVGVPGDKSITHRALLFAALAEGRSRIQGASSGDDNMSTLGSIRALGCEVDRSEDGTLRVLGRGSAGLHPPSSAIDCGNSGTTARLLSGLLVGCRIPATLVGDSSLSRRPMARVVEPLTRLGAKLRSTPPGGTLPLHIASSPLIGQTLSLSVASAQVKSAVLLAGLGAEGITEVHEPFPSRDHSERMLAEMGAPISFGPGYARIEGPVSNLRPLDLIIPGDPSTAAFFVCLAAMQPGSELFIPGVLVNPGRIGYLRILKKMGARIDFLNSRIISGEPVADLRVVGAELKAAEIGAADIPDCVDELPILAIVMSLAQGRSHVQGAGELRVKESDRINGIVQGLGSFGVEIQEFEDGFAMDGPQKLKGGQPNCLGDHRLIMAFSVAASIADGESLIENADAVSVSYPAFSRQLENLGVRIEHI